VALSAGEPTSVCADLSAVAIFATAFGVFIAAFSSPMLRIGYGAG
jgi:hypothetical protein